jgi:hypothetical protein
MTDSRNRNKAGSSLEFAHFCRRPIHRLLDTSGSKMSSRSSQRVICRCSPDLCKLAAVDSRGRMGGFRPSALKSGRLREWNDGSACMNMLLSRCVGERSLLEAFHLLAPLCSSGPPVLCHVILRGIPIPLAPLQQITSVPNTIKAGENGEHHAIAPTRMALYLRAFHAGSIRLQGQFRHLRSSVAFAPHYMISSNKPSARSKSMTRS